MAVFDNCSSVNIFNNEDFFKDANFSPAAAMIRNSSGVHTVTTKGQSYGFGEALFDKTVFINIICYYNVVKHPALYTVNKVCNADGIEIGYDVYLKTEKVMLSFREFRDVCIGSLKPLLEHIEAKKNDISLLTTSYDNEVYEDLNGCFSSFCYAAAGQKTVKQMKSTIKKDKLVGEIRRLQHRLGFVSDRHAEFIFKNYIKNTNIDPTVFRYTTLAYGPDLATLSGKTVKVTEHGYEHPSNLSPTQISCEMDIGFFNGYAEVIAVCHPGRLTVGHHLGPIQQGYNSQLKLRNAMEKIVLKLRRDYNKQLRCIFWDSESGAASEANKDYFAFHFDGLDVIALPSGVHCKIVERKCGTIKSKMRCCTHSLLYIIPLSWVKYFIHAGIWWTNMDSTTGNDDSTPPIFATLGEIDMSKYTAAHFGELVTTRKHNGLQHSSTELTRSELWVCLHPDSHHGTYLCIRFDSIGEKSPVIQSKRIHKVIVNVPAAVVHAISVKAMKERALVKKASFAYLDNISKYDTEKEMDQLLGFTKHDILKPPQEIQLKSADTAVNGKYTIRKSAAEYNPTIPQVLLNANLCSATDDFYRNGPYESCYSSMSNSDASENYFDNMFKDEELMTKLSQIETAYQIGDMSFVNDARKELVYNLALKMRDPGKTERSMEREMSGMVRNQSWKIRAPSSLTEDQKQKALRFIGFTKDKKSAPEGTKSRLVVNGAEQKHEDYDIYSEISASTGRRSNLCQQFFLLLEFMNPEMVNRIQK